MTTTTQDIVDTKAAKTFHALMVAGFAVFLLYRLALIFYPQPDIGGVEVNIVYFIQRLLDGQSLYTDPEMPPYAIAQYSPLYYYLCAGAGKLFGIQADEVLRVYTVSRCVSFVLNLLYFSLVFSTAKNIFSIPRRRSFYAAVFAFVFLEITSFSRPDSLNHFLFLLSLYFFMKAIKKGRNNNVKEIILAASVAALALFSKQTSFMLPILLGGWLLWKRQHKNFFQLGVAYAVTFAIILSIVLQVTNTDLFYKNVIMGINNGISPGWFKGVILSGYYYSFGMFFLLLFVILFFVYRKLPKTELLRFAMATLFFLFLFLNAVALKNGSNPGYYTEWWTLLFILTAFYWPNLAAVVPTQYRNIPAALVILVMGVKLMLLAKPVYKMTIENSPARMMAGFQAEKEIATELLGQTRPGDGYVVFPNYFTADSYLGSLLFRTMAMPQMDIIVLAAYPQKTYNYSEFVSRLKNGGFRWIVTRTSGPQQQFFDIPLNNYEWQKTIGGFNIYEYKPTIQP